MADLEHLQRVRERAVCLYDMTQVDEAIERIAEQLRREFAGRNPIILCAMNGGLVFVGRLLTKLDFPLQLDYVHTSRYGDNTVGGDLTWLVEPYLNLEGRSVLIVDDIVDRGVTLKAIHRWCEKAGAIEVKSATLVKKKLPAGQGCYQADFTALETPDLYLIGCGLDYQGYWRNAPGIYALNLEEIE